MSREVPRVIVDTANLKTQSLALLTDCIPGATPVHHTISAGDAISLNPGGCYRIFVLTAGEVVFLTGAKEYPYSERVVFIPDPELGVVLKSKTGAQLLEIRWEIKEGDNTLLEEYGTVFPYENLYSTSKQYRDRNKSDKTISRVMVEQRHIPRFCMGSVETYGYDTVKSHDHPMLDQFFFSFPENDMDVLIDFEPVPMPGNMLMYIPLGAMHGVEVQEGKRLHYMWIDFYQGEEGLKRLDTSHIATGIMAGFDEQGNRV
ncbi:MAG: hypothetical protein ABFC31_03115 [Clostridiaceae bacterium]